MATLMYGDSLTRAFEAPRDAGGPGARLVVISGPRQGAVYALTLGRTTLGRKPANGLVIPSEGVSKVHCTLLHEGGQVLITDHASTNGTFVNGRRLEPEAPVALAHGDVVTIFDSTLLFVQPSEERPEEPVGSVNLDREAAAREADKWLKEGERIAAMRRARRARG